MKYYCHIIFSVVISTSLTATSLAEEVQLEHLADFSVDDLTATGVHAPGKKLDIAFQVFGDVNCRESIEPGEAVVLVARLVAEQDFPPHLGYYTFLDSSHTTRYAYGRFDLFCPGTGATPRKVIAVLRERISGRCGYKYRVFGMGKEEDHLDWHVLFPGDMTEEATLHGCYEYTMMGFLENSARAWAIVLKFFDSGAGLTVVDLDGRMIYEGSADYRLVPENGNVVLYAYALEPVSEPDHEPITFEAYRGQPVPTSKRSWTHEALVLRKISKDENTVLEYWVVPKVKDNDPMPRSPIDGKWDEMVREFDKMKVERERELRPDVSP